jgi:hypothetical protein
VHGRDLKAQTVGPHEVRCVVRSTLVVAAGVAIPLVLSEPRARQKQKSLLLMTATFKLRKKPLPPPATILWV